MIVGDDGSLQTCTKEVNYAVIDLESNPHCKRNYRLVVVDTPGFDDPNKRDVAIILELLTWFKQS